MKINIIHSQYSNNVMNDAEVLNFLFKRQKDKTEVAHINIDNYTCPKAKINIFLEKINYSFINQASYNIFIPNQQYFSKKTIPLLHGIDMILCKTKYCYDTFKDIVPPDKIIYTGWRSVDISNHQIDKSKDDIMVLYTDTNYQDIEKLVNIWKLEYPTLNVVSSGVRRNTFKRRNLANIMYIDDISGEKYEQLFNMCHIHIVLDTISNHNHHLNQVMLCGNVPVCVGKGPNSELLYEDNFFGIFPNKKSIQGFLGSKYNYTSDNLCDGVEKAINTSLNTLESIGNNNRMWATRAQTMFNERIDIELKKVISHVRTIKKKEIKEYDDDELPTVSIVTVYNSTPLFFKLPVLNYRSFNYPREKLEWVVVCNNKEESIESMLPPVAHRESFRIKYTECDENSSYGEMLNVGVENASNELVMVMEDDYFFYQNGLRLIVNEYLNSKKAIIGCTTLGIFDINRYISVISGNRGASDYMQSVNIGSVMFSKSFWENGKFGINEGSELEEMINNRFAEYSEYSWNDKFVGLSYSKNENKWIVPDNQEANGCHYKFSKKVYEFLVSLDPKEAEGEAEAEAEAEPEDEDSNVKTI